MGWLEEQAKRSEAFLRSIPEHLRSPATRTLLGESKMEPVEGFYPPDEWMAHPQVHDCDRVTMINGRVPHEPHFYIPAFIREEEEAPEFICGGWPRKIIDIEEARDRK